MEMRVVHVESGSGICGSLEDKNILRLWHKNHTRNQSDVFSDDPKIDVTAPRNTGNLECNAECKNVGPLA